MALTLNEFNGFETEGSEEAHSNSVTNPLYPTDTPGSGGSYLRLSDPGDRYHVKWVQDGVTDAGETSIIGFRVRWEIDNTMQWIVGFRDDADATICFIGDQNSGTDNLILADATFATLDTLGTLTHGVWYYIELFIDLNSTSGDWEWFLDGVSQGSGSGADFNSGNAFGGTASNIRCDLQGTPTADLDFDDFYILSGATSADERLTFGGKEVDIRAFQGGLASSASDFTRTGSATGTALSAGTWDDVGDTPALETAGNIAEYTTDTTAQNGAIPFDAANAGGRPAGVADLGISDAVVAAKYHWHAKDTAVSNTTSYEGIYGKAVAAAATATVSQIALALTTAYVDYFKLIESADANCPSNINDVVMGFGKDATGTDDIQVSEMWCHVLLLPSSVQVNNFVGWETEGLEEADSGSSASPLFETTDPRSGGASLLLDDSGDSYRIHWTEGGTVDASGSYIIGFAYRKSGNPSATASLEVRDNSNNVISRFTLNTDGTFQWSSADNTVLDTTAALTNDQWYYFEMWGELNSASGDWEWFVDGISEGSGTAADFTDGGAFGGAGSILWLQGGPGAIEINYDDLYILSGCSSTADRLGPVSVLSFQPGKASSAADFDRVGAAGGDALSAGTFDDVGDTPLLTTAGNIAEYTTDATLQDGAVAFDDANAGGKDPGPRNSGISTPHAAKYHWHAKDTSVTDTTAYEGIFGKSVDAASTATVSQIALALTTAYVDYFKVLQGTDAEVPATDEWAVMGFGKDVTGNDDLQVGEMWCHMLVPFLESSLINTADRWRTAGALFWDMEMPVPHNAIDEPDRAAAAWTYSGLFETGDTFADIYSTIAAIASVTDYLDKQPGINVGISALSTINGFLSSLANLHGNIDGAITISSLLDKQPGLESDVAALSTINGFLSSLAEIYGDVDGTTTISALLDSQSGLESDVAVMSTINGFLSSLAGLYSDIDGNTTISALLDKQPGLESDIAALSAHNAILGSTFDLDSTIPAVSSVSAALAISKVLQSTISAVSAIAANLDAQQGLYSSIDGLSSILATLNRICTVNATIDGSTTIGALIAMDRSIDASIDGISTIIASLGTQIGFDATIGGLATINSILAISKEISANISSGATTPPIILDAAVTFNAGDSLSTVTHTVTISAGSDTFLIACLSTEQANGTDFTVDSVVWDGSESLTRFDAVSSLFATSLDEYLEIWYLKNPSPATGNVVWTLDKTSDNSRDVVTSVQTFEGASDIDLVNFALTENEAAGAIESTIASIPADSIVLDSISRGAGSNDSVVDDSGLGQTEQYETSRTQGTGRHAGALATKDAAGSGTMGWTYSGELRTIHSMFILNGTSGSLILANIDAQPGLWSNISVVSTILSLLDEQKGLVGTVAAISTITAYLDKQPGLESLVSVLATVNGNLEITIIGGFIDIDGLVSAVSTLTAYLDTQPGLEISIIATAVISAIINTQVGLWSNISVTSTIQSNLDAQSGLWSNIPAVSTMAGRLASTKDISSDISAVSSIAGSLDEQMGLNSTVAASTTIAALLSSTRSLASTIGATSAINAYMDRQPGLWSNIDGTASVLGELEIIGESFLDIDSNIAVTSAINSFLNNLKGLQTIIAATTSLDAALDLQTGLYGEVSATVVVAGELNPATGLWSDIPATSAINAKLTVLVPLRSSIDAASSILSTLGVIQELYSNIPATSGFNVALNVLREMDTVISATTSLDAFLGAIRFLDVDIAGTSEISGEMARELSLYVNVEALTEILAELQVIPFISDVGAIASLYTDLLTKNICETDLLTTNILEIAPFTTVELTATLV